MQNGLKTMGLFGLNVETEAPVFRTLISLDRPPEETRDLSLVGRNGVPRSSLHPRFTTQGQSVGGKAPRSGPGAGPKFDTPPPPPPTRPAAGA